MIKRCKFCGVKMSDAEIDGKAVYQCPICGFVVEKEEQKAATAPEPTGDEE